MLERILVFKDTKALCEAMAADFWGMSLTQGVKHIALSGGSTPMMLFEVLANEFNDKIDWSKFHFWWGDERCVPPDNDESNYKLAKEYLLDHIDIPKKNIHRIHGEAIPEKEAQRYGQEMFRHLPPLDGWPSFNLLLLGMGEDGHTASIFPNQMDLLNSKDFCAVANHPVTGQKRVTITGQVLNHARAVYFMITGASKAETLMKIISQNTGYMSYPAARVHAVNGSLNWWLDEEAASMIQ